MKPALHVLLVDDDSSISRTLRISLKDLGCTVEVAGSVAEAVVKLKKESFDLVLTDFRMEGATGLDLLKQVKPLHPETLVVVMTAYASFENAVSVVKEGAFDYLPKPFSNDQLEHLVSKVRTVVSLRRENRELKRSASRRDYFAGMTSPVSRRLEEFVKKLAPTEATILLMGESGTGKSELAKLIHQLSPRSSRPFVTVQCTALAESLLESELFGHVRGAFTGATQDKAGKLELAEGGTLFLDEIGEISLSAQAKLLGFLQERVFQRVGSNEEISVSTRVIAATNKDLKLAVSHGAFREDLYFRLNVLECILPPLRFRKDDLPVLIRRIHNELMGRLGEGTPAAIPRPVMEKLLAYAWPGNIRELRNVLERISMLARGREIQESDLPDSLLAQEVPLAGIDNGPFPSLEAMERQHIQLAMAREKNLEKAAKMLGITSVTLWRKRKEYGLD